MTNNITDAIYETCIFCGSTACVATLYGRIPLTKQLQADLDAKKVILGGCLTSTVLPMQRCLDCGKTWQHKEQP